MLILRHFCQHLKVAVTLGFSQRLRHYLVTVIEVCWPKARALVGFDNGVLQSLGSTATVRPGPTRSDPVRLRRLSTVSTVDVSPRIWGLPMAASQSSLKGSLSQLGLGVFGVQVNILNIGFLWFLQVSSEKDIPDHICQLLRLLAQMMLNRLNQLNQSNSTSVFVRHP